MLLLFALSILPLSNSQNISLSPWQRIRYINNVNPRHGHVGAYISSTDEYLLLTGTNSVFTFDNSLISIDMKSLASRQESANVPLAQRRFAAYAADLGDLYIHGGSASQCT
jgi:hypothetical protein